MLGIICAAILFVIFGQFTVRKLRKNPETRECLGVEFAHGLDILNVAQALSLPRSLTRKLNRSPLSLLHANSDVLFKHTTKFDRCLARACYWLLMGSTLPMLALAVIDATR